MEGGSHGTFAGIKLLHHTLYLLAKAGSIEVEAEHVGTAVQVMQATVVLVGLANLQWCHDGLQLSEHGVGRWLEGSAVVLDSFQVAGIASQGERDELEVRHVEAAGHILLDGLAKADGQFLAGIHGDALGCVGHEGVGKPAVDDRSDKLVRIEHTFWMKGRRSSSAISAEMSV